MARFDPGLLLDTEALVQRAFHGQRGPSPGWGRGPGKRWNGTVEDTPALWVTWLVDLCRRADVDPTSLRMSWADVPLYLSWVDLTFGRRYYWLCPRCGRRCEAVYLLRGQYVGCRQCLRLAYRSQTHRGGSALAVLDMIFSRKWPGLLSRRYDTETETAQALVGDLGALFRAKVTAALDALVIERQEEVTADNGQAETTE